MRGTAAGLLWVGEEGSGGHELVEGAAREFGMAPRFCRPAEVLEVIRGERVDLIGLELGPDPRSGLMLLKELHERLPRVTILAAASDTSVAVLRAALDGGATDVLSLPLTRAELHKAFIKFGQSTARNAAGRGIAGDVITVYGTRGGLGATTLAVNLAARLAALTSTECALVDLDLQRGDVAAFLNLTPTQSLAALAGARGEVDDLFLHGTLTRHSSGIFVLPAPPQMEEADTIAHGDVELALRLLRAQFRYTIIDTPRTITGPVAAAFEQTDRTLVLTDLSVPSVRAAQRTFELLTRLGTPREHMDLIVTEAVPGPLELHEVVRTLGREPLAVLPRDAEAAGKAMNSGALLNGPRERGLAVAVGELAAKLAGVAAPPRPKGGHLLRRIFSKETRP